MDRIPAFRMHAEPLTSEGEAMLGFKWAEDVGQRHQLGGEPTCFKATRRRRAATGWRAPEARRRP
jgi:hypothetical protein